ncbi:DUF2568 domain-containing protein [Apibacter muscae]|nr:DUF2568 domain-containing protein [Apibacter muscae]
MLLIIFSKYNFPVNFVVGIVLPLFVISIWMLFIAPKSLFEINKILCLTIEVILFSIVSYFIYNKISSNFGVIYFIFILLNSGLNWLNNLNQNH